MTEQIIVILLTCVSLSHCLNPNKFCGLDCDEDIPNTMCLTKCKDGTTCKDLVVPSFSESDKQYVLDIHNYLRNYIALGRVHDGGNHASSNMMALNYDNELADMALCWARQCITNFDPCSKSRRFGLTGQNFFKVSFENKIRSYNDLTHVYLFLVTWFNTLQMVDKDVLHHYVPGGYRPFTQLVWAKSTHVGCARIVHDEVLEDGKFNSLDMVCNYGPAGNIENASVYEFGPPASKCPPRTHPNPEYHALCGNVHILSTERRTITFRSHVGTILANQFVLLICWCLNQFIKFVH